MTDIKNIRFKVLILLSLVFLAPVSSYAQPVRVAVAANAQFVLKQLARNFKQQTGITVEVISGASGKLTAQIKNGAPYDVFLSADMDFAQSLFTAGFTLTKPAVYALGSLIVCSSSGTDVKNWKNYLREKNQGKIAIADPKLAPYGKAAEEALKHYKIYDAAADRLVFAESVGQLNTYVLKGVVGLGFTTQSLVYELDPSQKFSWEKVDPAVYSPIRQGAVLLKHSKKRNFVNSKRFFDYLFSDAAKAIFKKYGYTTT